MTNKLLTDYGDGMTAEEVTEAIALYRAMKKELEPYFMAIGLTFDGFQERPDRCHMVAYTDTKAGNTSGLTNIIEAITLLAKKDIAQARLAYMKRKGA